MSAATKATSESDAGSPAMPLFYQQPVALQSGHHATRGIRRTVDFGFAASAQAVPITFSEFLPALRSYPIVFAASSDPTPLVVMGLKAGRNLFTAADGQWRVGTYIPAYIRRYPFILIEPPDRSSRMLSVDEACHRVTDGNTADADPFFLENGQASETARAALAFCETFHAELATTRTFAQSLVDEKLLVPKRVDFQFPDGSRHVVDGFMAVDEDALQRLPGEKAQAWHANGWLRLIYLHLASQQNWELLLNVHNSSETTK